MHVGRALLACIPLICAAPWCARAQDAPSNEASTRAPDQTDQTVDTRAQYPAFLAHSFFAVNAGYIGYSFTQEQLEPGTRVASIATPHIAARIAVFGHEFGEHIAVQCTYMRPVRYVTYRDVNGDEHAHHVFAHFGGLTLQARTPITRRTFVYGEGGLGITSRRGFSVEGRPAIDDAHYASVLVGGGVDYRVSPTWTLTAGLTFSPASTAAREPHTVFASGGFRYTMRPLPQERVDAIRRAGFIFPAHLLQLEYSTGFGYGVNTFVSKSIPIFWGGNVKIDRGFAVHYDQNVFHTTKIFALDLGASVSSWRSLNDRNHFVTASVYPLLRFIAIRTRAADVYFSYSLAGPTYVSRVVIDGMDTGNHFTFQDFMGAGVFFGARRSMTAQVKINHYSNGNIFTHNAGLKVPLTFGIGWTF
jgi:hypothetical protein